MRPFSSVVGYTKPVWCTSDDTFRNWLTPLSKGGVDNQRFYMFKPSLSRDHNFWRVARSLFLLSALLGLVACFQSSMNAQETLTFTESFEGGTNDGGWTWGSSYGYFVELNGNPGWYVRDSQLLTFTPRASTSFGVQSVFTGNYSARNVASLGIDMAIAYADTGLGNRTVTLILLNDNGTPGDLGDDWGAFTVTDLPIPPTGIAGITASTDILQWVKYDVPVPAHSVTLPEGWTWISRNWARRNGSWGRLMRDVDHVGFILGDPALRYPLVKWDVALDNPRIQTNE